MVKVDESQPVEILPGDHISFKSISKLSLGHTKEYMSKFESIEDMTMKNSINFKDNRLYVNVSKEEIIVESHNILKFLVQAPIKLTNLLPYAMLYQVLVNGETKATKTLESIKEYEIFRQERRRDRHQDQPPRILLEQVSQPL